MIQARRSIGVRQNWLFHNEQGSRPLILRMTSRELDALAPIDSPVFPAEQVDVTNFSLYEGLLSEIQTGINHASTKGFRPSDPSHSGGNGWTGCSYKAKAERPGERGNRLSLGPNNEPAEFLLIVHGLPTPFFKRRLFNVTRSRDD